MPTQKGTVREILVNVLFIQIHNTTHIHTQTHTHTHTHTHAVDMYTHSSYMTLIGVHEMHGRVHPN